VGEFSAEWLALREPADHAARSARLARTVIRARPPDRPVRVLDLACGTGSNFRYLRGQLAKLGSDPFFGNQGERGLTPISAPDPDWLLVDRDAALLAHVPTSLNVATLQKDLATLDAGLFAGRTLVTASALLDLVSEEWLRTLATRCRDTGASALFALTYDGRVHCTPEEPEDELVRALVNRHQQTDKGFGPALGPDATTFAEQCFAAVGYTVRREPSDWVLDARTATDVGPSFSSGATPHTRELQRQLIEGWAEAARAIEPERSALIGAWRANRQAHLDAGRSRIMVGHEDLGVT
jgi:hypothetical protein